LNWRSKEQKRFKSEEIVMDIKPIRTGADYEAALKEVERLWGTEPGTPDGDRLEVLFTLVESYEDQQYPILPPDPIEAIKYKDQGLSCTGYRKR
jgi:HTH-type transcriptional regulator / antitoxin HigA